MSDSDSSRAMTSPSGVAKPPGALRRRATPSSASAKPTSSRSAGAGGSSSTMLKLYTDDSPGWRVEPHVVVVLAVSFIASIFFLHMSAKVIKAFTK
ncbi:hypothetical protein BD626DRAFT_509341 [Schizophyllum amplum]|uniref:Protein transport protein Sec61 subunit beta n=1 Tax=Schizophyllum amplum TaxID=97359 RepID=A0A550C2E4_9AGAR|nr:hypothetical protein BD626DRAFT_509341 [Auriculariopsis ampla]